jgi:bla regulator protein BlaR1
MSALSSLGNTSENMLQNSDWLQNFSVSSNRSSSSTIDILLLSIWIVGIFSMTIMTYLSNRNINKIKRTSQQTKDCEMLLLFEQCKQSIGIRKNIILYTCPLLSSPITFGLLKPCVIVPNTITADFSKKDLYYVFLHELHHYKHKDIFVNYAICFFRIVYWFHPVVWYALNEMRTDREIACDSSVLKMLDQNSYLEYGNTLINFADKILHSSSLSAISEMSGSNKQIKKRIITIASFQVETKWVTLKSVIIFLCIGCLVLASTPILSVRALANQTYNFSSNNTTYEDLSSYFDGYEGSFVLYDLQNDQYDIFNPEASQKRISPNSTYIVHYLHLNKDTLLLITHYLLGMALLIPIVVGIKIMIYLLQ